MMQGKWSPTATTLGKRAATGAFLAAVLAMAAGAAIWEEVLPTRIKTDSYSLWQAFSGNGASMKKQQRRHIQRGKPVQDITFDELYRTYLEVRDEYSEKAFSASSVDQWQLIKRTSDDIVVSILKMESDPLCPYTRISATIDASVDDVWSFLEVDNWEKNLKRMDPFHEGVEIFDSFHRGDVDMVLARKRSKRLFSFGKRDFAFLSVSDTTKKRSNTHHNLPTNPDNVSDLALSSSPDDATVGSDTRVSASVSIVTTRLPRQKGYTRAYQDSVGFYESLGVNPTTGEPRMRLTVICRVDLNDSSEDGEGGAVPMWLYLRSAGTTGPMSIRKLQREVLMDVQERRRQQQEATTGPVLSPVDQGSHKRAGPWGAFRRVFHKRKGNNNDGKEDNLLKQEEDTKDSSASFSIFSMFYSF